MRKCQKEKKRTGRKADNVCTGNYAESWIERLEKFKTKEKRKRIWPLRLMKATDEIDTR